MWGVTLIRYQVNPHRKQWVLKMAKRSFDANALSTPHQQYTRKSENEKTRRFQRPSVKHVI